MKRSMLKAYMFTKKYTSTWQAGWVNEQSTKTGQAGWVTLPALTDNIFAAATNRTNRTNRTTRQAVRAINQST